MNQRPAWLAYVGVAIRERRSDCKLTQQQVCARISVPGFLRTHLSRAEHNRHVLSIEMLQRIGIALGTSAAGLVRDAERWAELDAIADHDAIWQDGVAV
jgi:transcriptional regulator with XRE-family HTH domain